jgi:hypothetical protein
MDACTAVTLPLILIHGIEMVGREIRFWIAADQDSIDHNSSLRFISFKRGQYLIQSPAVKQCCMV